MRLTPPVASLAASTTATMKIACLRPCPPLQLPDVARSFRSIEHRRDCALEVLEGVGALRWVRGRTMTAIIVLALLLGAGLAPRLDAR